MSKFMMSKAAARRAAELDTRIDAVATADIMLHSREEFAAQIASLWRDAQQRFLLIGRYLIRAKQALEHGEYEKMISRDLPFSVQIAHQLKSVAEAVDTGRLLEDELPRSYSAVYQLTTLTDEELGLARARGLVRPDASRPQIVRFKQEIRGANNTSRRRQELERRRERLLEELRQIEAELGLATPGDVIEGEVLTREAGDPES